jgi:hypothetical protein
MPRIPSKTKGQRLSQYKIDEARYDIEKAALIIKGYSEEQTDRLILRIGSANTVKTLLEHHDELIALFTHGMLTKVAAHKGGGVNILALQKHFQQLTEPPFNFTKDQIVRMVSHIGGSKNLTAVKDNLAALQGLGFDSDQIVRMVSHGGGSNNLTAVKDNLEALTTFGFESTHIVEMVSYAGGANNLLAITLYSNALRSFNLNAADIMEMLPRDGELRVLKRLHDRCQDLLGIGHTKEEIRRIVLTDGLDGIDKLLDLSGFDKELAEAAAAALPVPPAPAPAPQLAGSKRTRGDGAESPDSLGDGAARHRFFAPARAVAAAAPPAPRLAGSKRGRGDDGAGSPVSLGGGTAGPGLIAPAPSSLPEIQIPGLMFIGGDLEGDAPYEI